MSTRRRGYPIAYENYFPSSKNTEDTQEEVPYRLSVSDGFPITESRIPSYRFSKYPMMGFCQVVPSSKTSKFQICRIGESEEQEKR